MMKFFDFVFLTISVGVTVVSGLAAWKNTSTGNPLVEIQSTQGMFAYPLGIDRDLHIKGPAGVTWLKIRNNQVYAVQSPGPRKIMMQMGKISQNGQWIASVPNHVFVRIVGGRPATVDAIVF